MSNILHFWRKIPRQVRIASHLIATILAIIAIYTFLGAPTNSIEAEFRRYEQAHMVGPSEILTTVNLEVGFDSYQKMMIADDGEGIIFFCYDHIDEEAPTLIYREKTGDITVAAAPYPTDPRSKLIKTQLPIFVFDEYPEAVRAEMELTLSVEYWGESFEKTYFLKSTREADSCFQFVLGTTNRNRLGIEGYAIQVLTLMSGYQGHSFSELEFPATVRLYDETDNLICEKSLYIRTPAGQAHAERGE